MTTLSLITVGVAFLYFASGLMIIGALKGKDAQASSWIRWPILLAMLLHAYTIQAEIFQRSTVHFGFGFAISAMLLFAALALFIESFVHRLHGQLGIVLIITGLATVFPILFPGKAVDVTDWTFFFRVHIILALAAYSFMTIAVVQAILMGYQNRALKRLDRKESGFMESMPGLVVQERIFFRIVATGFACLTAVLVTGAVATKEMLDVYYQLDHKFLLTVFSWVIFGILLAGRVFAGWRAKKALTWFWVGFIVYFVAYLGYSFVLELQG